MSIDQTQPTRLGTLVLGGVAGLIASVATIFASGHAIQGSAIITGNVITPSASNSAPSFVYDSGSYLTFQQTKLSGSGSAGTTYYMQAATQAPTTFFSGAILWRAAVTCGNKANAQNATLSVTTRANAGSGGLALRRTVTLGSGSLATFGTGVTKVWKNNYIVALSSSGTTANNGDCALQTWWHEKYGNR